MTAAAVDGQVISAENTPDIHDDETVDQFTQVEYSEIRLTRTELHAEVWVSPLLVLAKRWGVSDVAIGKACRRVKIPMPGRGYWAKRAAGAKVVISELPEVEADTPMSTSFHARVAKRSTAPRAQRTAPTANIFEAAGQTTRPHPLIAQARASAKSSRGLSGHFDIDLHVSNAALDRALHLLDAVFRLLEQQGVLPRNHGRL